MQKKLIQAIDHAVAGKWKAAHEIVQHHDTDTNAAWIHADLHKIEGDHENSHYWYHRAGQLTQASDDPKAELAEIKGQLTASPVGG